MSSIDKPWLELHPGNGDWWIASKNLLRPSSKNNIKDIVCYYIIQDCNMGGEYYRIYTWYKCDENRYFETKNSKSWEFNKEFMNLNEYDVVLNFKNNNKYKVSVKHECVKIMELI